MLRVLISFVCLASCAGINGAGGAEAQNEVIVEVAGEAYRGAPIFQVRFDGVVVGSAILQRSIDTVADGRLFEANDPLKHLETFRFEIPQEVFRPSGAVEMRLSNDAWGGDSANQYDRNLFVLSISVNGKKVSATDIKLQRKTGSAGTTIENVAAPALSHGFVALSESEINAVAVPGGNGWPPKAPAQPPTNDALKSRTATDTDLRCGGSVNVPDFKKNSAELSAVQLSTLDKLVSEIADRSCVLEVVGYASHGGTSSTNRRISKARAAAVADYLLERGVPADSAKVIVGGQTAKFGLTAADNQRVVITVLEK